MGWSGHVQAVLLSLGVEGGYAGGGMEGSEVFVREKEVLPKFGGLVEFEGGGEGVGEFAGKEVLVHGGG